MPARATAKNKIAPVRKTASAKKPVATVTAEAPGLPAVENVRYYRLHDLKMWSENYHKGDVPRVKHSFSEFGYNGVLRVWKGNVVYAGNTSLKALLELHEEKPHTPPVKIVRLPDGEWLVPGDDIGHLPLYKAQAFAVADNHTAETGTLDEAKLKDLLLTISANEPAAFTATGYTDQELDSMIKNVQEQERVGGENSPRGAKPEEILDVYLNGSIKQIVLYFENALYTDIVGRLERVSERFNVDNNTDAVVKLIEYYESAENLPQLESPLGVKDALPR